MKLLTGLLAITLLIVGCGGGSSGSGADEEDTNDDTQYSVSATVSGLSSRSVVLQLNGSDDLTAQNDGTVTFEADLESGDLYIVSILTQPNEASCNVVNGSGVVGSANVTNIIVACTSASANNLWSAPESIQNGDFGHSNEPRIAIDATGNAIAVWLETDEVNYDVWASRYVDGVGWSTPETISDPLNEDNATLPNVDIDDEGNAIVVWMQDDADRKSIWINRYNINSGWGTPFTLEDDDLESADLAQVAVNKETGSAIVIWKQDIGSDDGVWASHYAIASGWSDAEVIDQTANTINELGLAINRSNAAMALWRDNESVNVLNYSLASGWEDSEAIYSGALATSEISDISMNDDGEAIAVWLARQGEDIYSNVLASTYDSENGWQAMVNLETTTEYAQGPQVVMDNFGNAIAVWMQVVNADEFRVVANVYSSNAWGDAETISNEAEERGVNLPKIGVDGSGNAHVVYRQVMSVTDEIMGVSYLTGIGWQAPVTIESADQTRHFPQISVNNAGDAVVLWASIYESDLPFGVRASVLQ